MTKQTNNSQVFDRTTVRFHRDRAAAGFSQHAGLFHEVADQIIDRLSGITHPFQTILELGAHDGYLGSRLRSIEPTRSVIASDLSLPQISTAAPDVMDRLVADEEFLPFAPSSFDLIVSNLSLHWVNDLPGTLSQIYACLKPGGLFIATLFGETTLLDLRQAIVEAEVELSGGISPRLSPVLDMPTASMLLQRAQFTLPVTDLESFHLVYSSPLRLMHDLRHMGESNAHTGRTRTPTNRRLFPLACAKYPARPDGRITADFDVIFLHGWK